MAIHKSQIGKRYAEKGVKAMIYFELRKAIVEWLLENENVWQRTNECREHFRQYIYNDEGNYIIGGKKVSDFISNIDTVLFYEVKEVVKKI